MFDIGWTELLVIAMVTIIVVGPKDLPRVMRTIAQTIGKLAEAIIGQRHAAALDLGNRGDCQPGALGDLGQRQALLEPDLAQPFAHADPAVLPIRYGVDALVHARV